MAKPWADGPFPLSVSPRAQLGDKPQSGASISATEMSNAHNMLIRALNSISLQAVNIVQVQDIEDFMFYAKIWVSELHQHHATEEEMAFPLIEEETEVKGIMDGSAAQHEAFSPGVDRFSDYINSVSEKKVMYDGHMMVKLISSFAPILLTHLQDEVDTIASLDMYVIDWTSVNKAVTDYALKKLDKDVDIGMVVTHTDSTFEGGLHNDTWPPFPWIASVLFRWIYVPKRKEICRFAPCDPYFKPRELPFA